MPEFKYYLDDEHFKKRADIRDIDPKMFKKINEKAKEFYKKLIDDAYAKIEHIIENKD